jgi:hypothetical protein
MNVVKHDQQHHEAHSGRPRRKRVHHSWIFWVAVFLMLIAMITYINDRRPVLGPASPAEAALNARARKIKPAPRARVG